MSMIDMLVVRAISDFFDECKWFEREDDESNEAFVTRVMKWIERHEQDGITFYWTTSHADQCDIYREDINWIKYDPIKEDK